jgi:hypothetical protein
MMMLIAWGYGENEDNMGTEHIIAVTEEDTGFSNVIGFFICNTGD